jgi:hypothetical protein
MKQLNLKKLWEVCNKLSWEQEQLSDKNIWVNLLGINSGYVTQRFENFLEDYSFRIQGDNVVVFINEPVPYEDFNYQDFSYVPLSLLFGGEKELEEYIKTETERQLEQQRKEKDYEKERLKLEIERLQNKLNNL